MVKQLLQKIGDVFKVANIRINFNRDFEPKKKRESKPLFFGTYSANTA